MTQSIFNFVANIHVFISALLIQVTTYFQITFGSLSNRIIRTRRSHVLASNLKNNFPTNENLTLINVCLTWNVAKPTNASEGLGLISVITVANNEDLRNFRNNSRVLAYTLYF